MTVRSEYTNNAYDLTTGPFCPSEVEEERRILFSASSLLFIVALIGLFAVSHYSFLLFHVLAEFFSIVVAAAMFMIAWNTQRFMKNNYLLFLGSAYLFVGFIDLLHTLAYKGMGVFPDAGANLPTQLWLAGRYLEAGSLLIAPFLIGRTPRFKLGLFIFTCVTALLLSSIFLGWFPDAYLPGSGLTAFKIGSEYVICLMLLAAARFLWKKREHFQQTILNLVIMALAATIISELLFTFYINVYGLSNLMGHYFKIISFFLIYLAVIRKGLTDPYSLLFRRLAERERLLDDTQAIARVGGWELDLKTNKQRWTIETYRLHEVGPDFDPDLEGGLSFFHGENRRMIEEAVNRCATAGEHYELELQMVTARDKAIWVRARGKCILDNNGRPCKLTGTIQDVTDWKLMQERLEKAMEAANAASRAKTDFLANMSHELRTPLTGILGMLQMARDKADNREQRERLGMALKSAETLLDIINDVLDISKIEAGAIEFQLKPFELGELLDVAETTFGEAARKKGLDLLIITGDHLPECVVGDMTRVRQVVFNLLNNALKFTKSGRIELRVERIPRDDPRMAHLLFSVSDTGTGVPEGMLDAIFEKFTQSEQGKRAGGTGLGLSIVKRLVRAMGGEINVESKEGAGTTFHFDLKLLSSECLASEPEPEPETDEEYLAALEPLKVLVAEDDETSRMVDVKYLEAMGHEATAVVDGGSTISALQKARFDAVLLDMNLPDMEGIEVVRLVRSGASGRLNERVPIIAVTGYTMAGDRERFLKAGLDGYLSKPFDPNTLKAALARAISDKAASP